MEQAVVADGTSGRVVRARAQRPGVGADVVGERSIRATRLPGSTLLSSALHVAEHRVRGALSLLR